MFNTLFSVMLLPSRYVVSKTNLPFLRGLIVLSLLLSLSAPFSRAGLTDYSIVVVIHVDALPQFKQQAIKLLTTFREDSLHDRGLRTFQLLQELGNSNHFTLVQEWITKEDYDNHNSLAHTRSFRDRIQSMLGSPFDERLHRKLDSSP